MIALPYEAAKHAVVGDSLDNETRSMAESYRAATASSSHKLGCDSRVTERSTKSERLGALKRLLQSLAWGNKLLVTPSNDATQ